MPPVPQCLSSSIVLPKYSQIGRLTNSRAPLGVKTATNPGMPSTIRRDSRSLSRSASLAMPSSNERAAPSAAHLTDASTSHLHRQGPLAPARILDCQGPTIDPATRLGKVNAAPD